MPNPESTDKIYLEHARTSEQLADMHDIAKRGICFMCPEHIPEFYEERGGLIAEGESLFWVKNGYPYENTEHHLMAIPKKHISSLSEVSEGFWTEVLGFLKAAEEEFGITSGAIAMRFGNPAETGATAHHLHLHFIVPLKDLGPEDKPVRFRMSPRY